MARVLTKKERGLIITLRHAGYRICEIAREMGITKKTIYKWLRHYEKEGNVETRIPPPAKRATTIAQDEAIIQAHRENPLRSTAEDAKAFVISTQTVRRRLREAGLRTISQSTSDDAESDSTFNKFKTKKRPSTSNKCKSKKSGSKSIKSDIEQDQVEKVCERPPFELVEVHYGEPETLCEKKLTR